MIDLVTTASPDQDSVSFLQEGIRRANNANGLIDEPRKPLAVFAYEDERLIGGVSGATKWDHFVILSVFVDSEHQRRGVGSQLLRAAEREACARHCVIARTVTNEHEAPGFYEKNGYKCGVVLEDHPVGSKTFYYMKRLDASHL